VAAFDVTNAANVAVSSEEFFEHAANISVKTNIVAYFCLVLIFTPWSYEKFLILSNLPITRRLWLKIKDCDFSLVFRRI
ncbi:hypothetical protein, partial [Leptospira santarosai]|uniref:hypothetical protein n=1 Tax=Leptospira santarosai TaxID=28183 RepID=UPI0024AFBAAD